MNTQARAQALVEAASPWAEMLGLAGPEPLLELIRCELGHEGILDDLQAHGPIHAKAIPLGKILHIVAGNTPAAALQSLIRGLLLGAHNRCKIPSAGLPEVHTFQERLPPELGRLLEVDRELPEEWISEAEAVIVFGNDQTIGSVQQQIAPTQVFLPHGHKVSAGLVWDDIQNSLDRAARDICLFDQKGCLSLHTIYVDEARCGASREYGALLAKAIRKFSEIHPRGAITPFEHAEVQHLRSSYRFRAANDPRVAIWESEGTEWTVIQEDDALFSSSCLNRLVFVKPLPSKFEEAFLFVRPHLSTLALWPFTLERARSLLPLGFSRYCALGESQRPSWVWHQDGQASLARLVRWIDVG